ncbi:hypothetical protein ACU5AX_09200 [Sphingomonas sp. XXL09]|uniref:hypothetical protein n=1 Tax=Sphingomonas sp. XXL09 TaxID=3457787 RepID=UPI00406BCAD3
MKILKLLAVVPMALIVPSVAVPTPAKARGTQCMYDSWHIADRATNNAPHTDPDWQAIQTQYMEDNCGEEQDGTSFYGLGYYYCENRHLPELWPADQPYPAGWGGFDCRPI